LPDGRFPIRQRRQIYWLAFADEETIKADALKNHRFIERCEIDDWAPIINETADNPLFFNAIPLQNPPQYSHTPHSRSIVFYHNAFDLPEKIFSAHDEEPSRRPVRICALEFKGEFHRAGICSVSTMIDNDRSIFHLHCN
jgi:hypothetical protein